MFNVFRKLPVIYTYNLLSSVSIVLIAFFSFYYKLFIFSPRFANIFKNSWSWSLISKPTVRSVLRWQCVPLHNKTFIKKPNYFLCNFYRESKEQVEVFLQKRQEEKRCLQDFSSNKTSNQISITKVESDCNTFRFPNISNFPIKKEILKQKHKEKTIQIRILPSE